MEPDPTTEDQLVDKLQWHLAEAARITSILEGGNQPFPSEGAYPSPGAFPGEEEFPHGG